MTESTDFFKQ